MKESEVEKYLNKRVTENGGMSRKWTSPNRAGVPDRIVIYPGNRVFFVEVKTDNGKTTTRQEREIETLRSFGCTAWIVYGERGVEQFVHAVNNGL